MKKSILIPLVLIVSIALSTIETVPNSNSFINMFFNENESVNSSDNILQETATLKGQITDKTNHDPISFANVILELNGIQIAKVTSDLEGYYEFKRLKDGVYDLSISYIGYKNELIKAIELEPGKVITHNVKLIQTIALLTFELVEEKETEIASEVISYSKVSKSEIRHMPGVSSNKKCRTSANFSTNYYNEQNNESYEHYKPNQFDHVSDAPLSTFSIDVDAASYSNARRFIQQGNLPPIDAVRTEEFINYFSYDYPQPEANTPFSITTEIGPCPWNSKNKLLHIGLQGKKIEAQDLPAGNFVFLIDVSGSMDAPNRLPLVKKSLRLMVNELRREDQISIVVYAGAAGIVLEPTRGDKKDKIMDAIENLNAGGSTAGGQGILLAYKTAKDNFLKNGNNRVIIATDGDFNVGVSTDNELVKIIEEKREEGIFLTVLGYGMGNYKDAKLEKLANKGNGNFAYIDNLHEANKVLVKELGATLLTIAKDVKIQIEFNPHLVKGYRLIGYENRMLEAKDFNDDKKDAGELGAGHTVTALYELIVSDEDFSPKTDPLKYRETKVNSEAFNSDEIATVKLRYKEPKESKSKLFTVVIKGEEKTLGNASNDFRFSASIAQFGMLLANSEFKGNTSYVNTMELARGSKGKDEEGYRAEFIRLVELASKLDQNQKTVRK
ncbi:MAG: von Willebrand factor type A domain-containing protein [Bacteroidota bacterium]|nr:von Willebrand factor type A domain-containing protein [Bacteroidota bacterium]